MNNFLGQLGLTAQERRIVVAIFLVVFVVLNYLFVWPSFGEWSSLNKQRRDMLDKIGRYNNVIKQDYAKGGWRQQVEELTKRQGASVMEHPVDPQVQFQNTIRAQERKTGVQVKSVNPGSVKTNDEFFEEQSASISLECQESQLVGFLHNMGNDPAMIRVSILHLAPADANRYRLMATLTLTANYSKKPPAAVSEPVAAKHASAAKPAAAPGPKPAAAPGAKPRGVPAPMQGPAAKHPPGPFVPKQPPAGKNVPIPARPTPVPKPVPSQKAME